MSDVSGVLLAILAMAALLGALIGGAVALLLGQRHVRRLEEQVAEARSSSDRDASTRLAISQQTLERERQASQELIAGLRARERDAVARHDALQVHSRTQARRIETLQGEQLAAEERQMRLDRALHTQREELGWTVRDRSTESPRQDVTPAGNGATPLEEATPDRSDPPADQAATEAPGPDASSAVPVLRNPRSTSGLPAANPRSGSRSRLASGRLARGTGGSTPPPSWVRPLDDGEFPALSEADLPDSVDGLELEGSRDGRSD